MEQIAVYCRISADQEGRREGVDRQAADGRRYAVERWPGGSVEIYSDNDLSAATPGVFRPDFERLLDDIRSGHVNQLVVTEQSRLTRRPSEWESLVVALSAAGVDTVHTIRNGPVAVRDGNRLLGRILAAVDAEEAERTRARVTRALQSKAEQGHPAGGRVYGYERGRDSQGVPHLTVHPEQAQVVQRVAAALEAGQSLRGVALALDADGIPTPRGAAAWSSQTVRSIVCKPTVAGLRTHRGQLTAGTWEAILEESRWRRLVALLGGNRVVETREGRSRHVSARRRGAPRKYLLSGGLLRCANCGMPLETFRTTDRKGARPGYACVRRAHRPQACGGVAVAAALIEGVIEGAVLEVLQSKSLAEMLATAAGDDTSELVDELEGVEGRLRELGSGYALGDIDAEAFRAAQAAASERARGLRRRLEQLAHAVTLPDGLDSHRPITAEAWADLPVATRREVLALLIERVELRKAQRKGPVFDSDRVSIRWKV